MPLGSLQRRLISISVGLFIYLLFGAVAFRELEHPNEERLCDAAIYQFDVNLPIIMKGIIEHGLNYTNFNDLQRIFQEAHDAHISISLAPDPYKVRPYEPVQIVATCPMKWILIKSFFFCSMIVSTIGYGGNSPVTTGGQLFCIFYSIGGIIIFGFFLTIWSNSVLHYYSKFYKGSYNYFKEQKRIDLKKLKINEKTAGVTLVALLFFILPCFGFMASQGWSYMGALYYCVVSLSTIGFGDYVPAKVDTTSIWQSFYASVCLLWIYFGLVCVSVAIRKLGEGMGYLFKIESDENENFDTEVLEGGIENVVGFDRAPSYELVVAGTEVTSIQRDFLTVEL